MPDDVSSMDHRAWSAQLRQLALQRDPASFAAVATSTLAQITGAVRVHCLFHDDEARVLWRMEGATEGPELPAHQGLAGWAATTGRWQGSSRFGEDARYVEAIDDPGGSPWEHGVALPVAVAGQPVHAVFVIVCPNAVPPLSTEQCEALQGWARMVAPLLVALDLESRDAPSAHHGPFRPAAVRAHRERSFGGAVLREPPAWTQAAYRMTLLCLLVAVALLAVERVDVHARGHAVVIRPGSTDLTAVEPGTVAAVHVEPGQEVAADELLVELEPSAELAALDAAREARRQAVIARLSTPDAPNVAERVAEASARIEAAKAALEQRRVRAPFAGVVGDVRIRVGQAMIGGDTAVTLLDPDGPVEVRAFVPAADRPALNAGQTMLLDLDGFADVPTATRVSVVSTEGVGAGEVARWLGRERADAMPLQGGSWVMVSARVPSTSYEAHGTTFAFHEGMTGTAEIRLDSKSLVFVLFPDVEEWIAEHGWS